MLVTSSGRAIFTVVVMLATALGAGCEGETEKSLLAAGKASLANADNKSAIIYLKRALEKDPQSVESRFLLGRALLADGAAAAAAVELNKAVALGYPAAQIAPDLARALLQQGENKKLVDQYSDTKPTDPNSLADLKTTLATAMLRLGQRESAKIAIDEALLASPDFSTALIIKARVHAVEGGFETSLAIVDKVLKSNPKDYLAWQLKGDVNVFGRGDKAAGLAAYRKALEIEPRFMPAHTAIIAVLMKEKDVAGLKAQITEARKAFPKHPQVLLFEAQLALLERDVQKGRELTQQLLRHAPESIQVLQLAGTIELLGGGLVQAEAHLSKSLQLAPTSPLTRRLLAQVHLRSGQANKALTDLAPLLQGVDDEVATLSLAGEAELVRANLAVAANYFERALKLDPKDARLRTAAALARASRGGAETLPVELETIAASDSGTVADLALISIQLKERNFDGALRAISMLERKLPDHPLPQYLGGRVMLAKGDRDAARASFDRALLRAPSYFPAASGLAALDIAENKPDAARQRFEAILKSDPNSMLALLAIAQLKSSSGSAPSEVEDYIRRAIKIAPNDPEARLMLTRHLLAQRKFKDAVTAAQEAISALPDDPRIIQSLGHAQLKAGDNQQSISTYRRLVAANPNSPEPHLLLAAVNLSIKNREAASQSYRRALELSNNLPLAQASLIALAMEDGRFDEARQQARLLQKQKSNQPAGWVYEGDIEFSNKNYDGSINAYRTALTKQRAADIAVKLHRALLAGKRPDEAAQLVAEWDRSSPRDPAFQMYLGDESLTREDFAAAESRYRVVIAAQPRNALAYNNLSYALLKQGKDGAVNAAEKANELLPGRAVLIDSLAMALAGEKKFDKAIAMQQKALSIAPDNPGLRLNLAKIYMQAGEKAQANKELTALANLGDKYAGQAEVKRMIEAAR